MAKPPKIKRFNPHDATPQEVEQLYLQYLGALTFLGNEAPKIIGPGRDNENSETIERIFDDCLELTGIPYQRTINRFDFHPERSE